MPGQVAFSYLQRAGYDMTVHSRNLRRCITPAERCRRSSIPYRSRHLVCSYAVNASGYFPVTTPIPETTISGLLGFILPFDSLLSRNARFSAGAE